MIALDDGDDGGSGFGNPFLWFGGGAALLALALAGAYTMFAEDSLGSIEVGKLADFVVIPVDYMTIPAEDIWKIEPEMTVIGGEVVYTKPVPGQ